MTSDTTSDTTIETKEGFFDKILSRRKTSEKKSSKSRRSTRNKGLTKKITKNDDEQVKRRVIKATRPPSPTTDISSIIPSEQETTEIISSMSSTTGSRGNNKLPTIQNENLREKTEQWRKERMDATAANQKLNKEKGVMEHRLKGGKAEGGGEGDDNGKQTRGDQSVFNDMEVSDIFITRTFHPENKRKASSHDHGEKKTKVEDRKDMPEEYRDDEEKDETDLIEVTHSSKLPSWIINVAMPAAIVAACAAIMMRALRKR